MGDYGSFLDGFYIIPGAYDVLSAYAVERGGYPVAYFSVRDMAFGKSYPDIGVLNSRDILDILTPVARQLNVRFISEISFSDENALQVYRDIQSLESLGCYGVVIDDVECRSPCLGRFKLAGIAKFARRIEVARSAISGEMLLVAKIEASRLFSIEEGIDRAYVAHKAGADLIIISDCASSAHVLEFSRQVPGRLMIYYSPEISGSSPCVQALKDMNYSALIIAGKIFLSASNAVEDELINMRSLKWGGDSVRFPASGGISNFNKKWLHAFYKTKQGS